MDEKFRGEGLGYQTWRVRGCVGLKNFEGFGRFAGLESSRVYGHRMEGWVRCYLGKAVSKGV